MHVNRQRHDRIDVLQRLNDFASVFAIELRSHDEPRPRINDVAPVFLRHRQIVTVEIVGSFEKPNRVSLDEIAEQRFSELSPFGFARRTVVVLARV